MNVDRQHTFEASTFVTREGQKGKQSIATSVQRQCHPQSTGV